MKPYSPLLSQKKRVSTQAMSRSLVYHSNTNAYRKVSERTKSAASSRSAAQYMTRQRLPLVGRTLAEENLQGFNFKKRMSTNASSMNPYAPQRIELPLYFNTPQRMDDLMDAKKYKTYKKGSAHTDQNASFINNESALNMSYVEPSERIVYKKRIKDYSMLAFACKRANKLRDEGRAYYSSGVLYDNLGQYQKAIMCYQKFQAVCKKIGDTHGNPTNLHPYRRSVIIQLHGSCMPKAGREGPTIL